MHEFARARRHERGFASIALITLLVPLMFMVGSYLKTMSGRQNRLLLEIQEEQALLTAESGIDLALNAARQGLLVAGHLAEYSFGQRFEDGTAAKVRCFYLGDDDVDNDFDGQVDEDDEDVFQVVSNGYGNANSQRRVVAFLGYSTFDLLINGAVTVTSPATTIDLGGSGMIDGSNRALDGSLVGADDGYGLSITSPGTTADLSAELSTSEESQVDGLGGTPSLGTTSTIDVNALVAVVKNMAPVVFTNSRLQNDVGSATAPVVAYRQGDFLINGNNDGYGLLVVDGDLRINGNATWHGVIVCTGTVTCGNGTFKLYGGMVLGPSSPEFTLRGTIDLNYSAEGVATAEDAMGQYTAFNGWQEISTNGETAGGPGSTSGSGTGTGGSGSTDTTTQDRYLLDDPIKTITEPLDKQMQDSGLFVR